MIRHAADPDKFKPMGKIKRKNYFEWMLEEIAKVVKQGVTKSATDDQTEHRPDKIVQYRFRRVFKIFIFYPVESQKINYSETDKIHQAVIVQLK